MLFSALVMSYASEKSTSNMQMANNNLQVTIIRITESKENKFIQRLDVSGSTGPGGRADPLPSPPPALATALVLLQLWWAILPHIYSMRSALFLFEGQKHQIEWDGFCQKVLMLGIKFQGSGYNELQHFSEILLVWISQIILLNLGLRKQLTCCDATTGFPVKWRLWEMSAKIPYWWHVTSQTWVVLLIVHALSEIFFNQLKELPRSGKWHIVCTEFLHSFPRRHFTGQPGVNKPFRSVIYKCSYWFRTLKQ